MSSPDGPRSPQLGLSSPRSLQPNLSHVTPLISNVQKHYRRQRALGGFFQSSPHPADRKAQQSVYEEETQVVATAEDGFLVSSVHNKHSPRQHQHQRQKSPMLDTRHPSLIPRLGGLLTGSSQVDLDDGNLGRISPPTTLVVSSSSPTNTQKQKQRPESKDISNALSRETFVSDITSCSAASEGEDGSSDLLLMLKSSTPAASSPPHPVSSPQAGQQSGGGIAAVVLEPSPLNSNNNRNTNNAKPLLLTTSAADATVENSKSSNNNPQRWWLGMFQRMEQQHEEERETWQRELQAATEKQSLYRTELRQNISQQLQWLEERVMAPKHVLPGIHSTTLSSSHSTASTTPSTSGSHSDGHRRRSRGKHNNVRQLFDQEHADCIVSATHSNAGIEVTFDSAAQVQRLQELEQCLQQTVEQHARDRLEWVRALEEAAAASAAGEQMTVQQQQQLRTLQSEMDASNRKQRVQWKEKTRVLAELLQLTEQQHNTEKLEWTKEQERLESTTAQLVADRRELMTAVEQAAADKIHSCQQVADEWQQKMIQAEQSYRASHDEMVQEVEKVHQDAILYQQEMQQQVDRIRQEALSEQQEMQQQLEDIIRQQQERELEIEPVQKEAMVWKEENEKLQSDTLALKQENEELQQSAVVLKHENEELQQSAAVLKQENDTLQQSEILLKQENEELQQNALVLKQENEELQKGALAVKQDLEKLEEELGRVKEEANTFKGYAADFTEQATISKKQCTVLQKNLAAAASDSCSPRMMIRKRGSPLSSSSSHLPWDDNNDTLDRAMAERDLYQQEAAARAKELEELKKQLQESKKAPPLTTTTTPAIINKEAGERDIIAKYKDSMEKHSELVNRLKQFEDQRATDRGTWKLQLEAALTESRKLHDENKRLELVVSELSESHAAELQDLKAQLQQAESDVQERCDELDQIRSYEFGYEAQIAGKLQEQLRACELEMERLAQSHATELKDLNEQLHAAMQWKDKMLELEKEVKIRCDNLIQDRYLEVSELKDRLRAVEKESEQAIADLQREYSSEQKVHEQLAQREQELQQWMERAKSAQAENRNLIDRVDDLSKRLAEFKRLHSMALKKYDRALVDRNGYKEELANLRRLGDDYTVHQEVAGRLERHQNLFLNAVDELRQDISLVRDVLETKTTDDLQQHQAGDDRIRVDALHGHLARIQSNLNDAVAKLSSEADALIQSREAIKTAVSEASLGIKEKSRFLEQHERLLNEVCNMREHMNKALQNYPGLNDSESLSRELITELQQKEAALATAQTELRHYKEKFEAEIAARQVADAEIGTLNDQADAYEEELMTLQSTNANLSKKLHDAGLKIDASLLSGRMPTNDDSTIGSPRNSSCPDGDESLPVLDEALALAEGLTNIVHGRGAFERESSAMEMLESMSEMIDVHDLSSRLQGLSERTQGKRKTSMSPQKRHRKVYDDFGGIEVIHELSGCESDESTTVWFDDENPPMPVATPLLRGHDAGLSKHDSTLQLVVEQLYGRCQLLERERVDMMEVTLDLLESARDANSAELEAALATARRKSAEEMVRVRDQNRQEQERIFHKLCSRVVRDGEHLNTKKHS